MDERAPASDWIAEQIGRDREIARALSVLGIIIVPLWIPFDLVVTPDLAGPFAAVRLTIVCLCALVLLVLPRLRSLAAVRAASFATLGNISIGLGGLIHAAGEGGILYVMGSSVMPWVAGTALSWPPLTMLALQALIVVPILVALPPGDLQQSMLTVSYYTTTVALCTVLSAVRLGRFKQLFETRRALDASEVRAAHERAANLAKTLFLARMSHELRTPLNAIMGYAALVEEDLRDGDTESARDDLGRIETSGKHLIALINDLLDLSRIEAGEVTIATRRVALGRVVTEAAEDLRRAASRRRLTLDVRVSPDLGELTTDPQRVRQIIVNLVSNAVRFTERGGIQIDVEPDSTVHARITVRDTGIGIPPDALPHLFDPFYQVDPSFTRRHDGAGLGLAIVRQLAQCLGGDVTVRSQVGVGSTFVVTLADLPGELAPGEPSRPPQREVGRRSSKVPAPSR